MRVERSLRGTTVSLPAEGLGYNRGVEAVSLCDVYYVMRMSVRYVSGCQPVRLALRAKNGGLMFTPARMSLAHRSRSLHITRVSRHYAELRRL